jgi:hypothetical protein
MKKKNGSWQFTTEQNGSTKIVWEYKLLPKNNFAGWLVKNFMYKDISKLCENAIKTISKDLEK